LINSLPELHQIIFFSRMNHYALCLCHGGQAWQAVCWSWWPSQQTVNRSVLEWDFHYHSNTERLTVCMSFVRLADWAIITSRLLAVLGLHHTKVYLFIYFIFATNTRKCMSAKTGNTAKQGIVN